MEDINRLQYLLDNVSIISKKYEDIAKISGENFNVFSVMNMEWDEVYTHSAIIGELLNPKGSHGQGDTFLSLFLSLLNETFKEKEDDFSIENFNELTNDKICERTISEVNLIEGIGGRIDIILEDKNQIIIIENKPGYQDQPLQLIRYSNYAIKKGKPFKVFYLTMDGRNLKEFEKHIFNNKSIETENENIIEVKGFNFHYSDKEKYEKHQIIQEDKIKNYKCIYYPISFYTEIVNWLEKCLKEVNNHPLLYTTITQYLNLVKKLTNQTQNNKMKREIIDTIKNNLTYSNLIFQNYIQAKNEILNSIKDKIFEKLTNEFSEKYLVHLSNEGVDKPNSSIIIKPKEFENESSFFCINSFSGIVSSENLFNSTLFIGILDYEEYNRNHFLNSELKNIGWWWEIENIVDEDSSIIKFADLDFLQKLANNLDKKEMLIECIFNSVVKYINKNEVNLFKVLESKKLLD